MFRVLFTAAMKNQTNHRYSIALGCLALILALPACTESAPLAGDGETAMSPGNCSFDSEAPDTTFDTVITGGRVMDPECNFDGVRNVGITGDRIAW